MTEEPVAQGADRLRIEYVPLPELLRRRHPRNPKDHALEDLDESMSRFGYTMPVALDEESGNLAAGHGRVDALESRRQEGDEPPDRVEVEDGEWLVPTIRGLSFSDRDELLSYLLADNRLTEAGGWMPEILAEDVEELTERLGEEEALRGTGIDEGWLEAVADWEPDGRPEAEEDEFEGQPPEEAVSARGEVYELGPHRLMCGDATDEEDVERLLDGAEPRLMVTDPPYGVEYDPEWRSDNRTGEVSNDDRIDWRPAWALSPAVVAYIWHAGRHASVVQQGIESCGYTVRSQIIWVKDHFPLSRGHYHWRHEPCWYAVADEGTAAWIGDRKQTTVWEIREVHPRHGSDAEDFESEHGAQKPVETFARAIRNHEGGVYDPFAGSGTAIIAAEQLGRTCYAMEIDPAYCDVIRRRYAEFVDDPSLAP